jgi:hypothetical protein
MDPPFKEAMFPIFWVGLGAWHVCRMLLEAPGGKRDIRLYKSSKLPSAVCGIPCGGQHKSSCPMVITEAQLEDEISLLHHEAMPDGCECVEDVMREMKGSEESAPSYVHFNLRHRAPYQSTSSTLYQVAKELREDEYDANAVTKALQEHWELWMTTLVLCSYASFATNFHVDWTEAFNIAWALVTSASHGLQLSDLALATWYFIHPECIVDVAMAVWNWAREVQVSLVKHNRIPENMIRSSQFAGQSLWDSDLPEEWASKLGELPSIANCN